MSRVIKAGDNVIIKFQGANRQAIYLGGALLKDIRDGEDYLMHGVEVEGLLYYVPEVEILEAGF